MKFLPLHNEHFERLLKEFDLAVKTKGYAKPENLYSFTREFLFFLEGNRVQWINEVQAQHIIAYYEYLQERPNQKRGGGLSEKMIGHHLYAVRLFFDYLVDTEQMEASPARLPKFTLGKGKERSVLTLDEIQQLYKACETKRDRALISVAYGCGLRRNEIVQLNVNDVLLHKGMLLVREGKGGKFRTVPLSDSVLKDLREYVIYERPKYFQNGNFQPTPAFFVGNHGMRPKGKWHNNRLAYLIQRTQNPVLMAKGITLHCLRHSIATHLLDNGASIEFVQKFLGHAEMDTALIYSRKRKQRLAIMNQTEKSYEARAII